MISINNISKYYGKKKVLDNISCTFDTGINSILGPNGAGKTTLMNIICNTIKCQNGEVYYDNTPIIKLEEKYRKDLSVLFQNNPVYPNYTAKEYLKFVGILKGMDKERIETEISRTLDLVNLSDECNKKIKSFSGGMRQRLGIAQALMNTPKIIIFDEPSVGLDPKEREQFKRIIYKLKMNSIIIISTHIVSDIDKISDRKLQVQVGHPHGKN